MRFLFFTFIAITLFLDATIVVAKEVRRGVRIIYLDEMKIAPIYVHPDGVVLNFPTKPDVHVGKKDVFNIVYVKNDLVVSANSAGAKTNLFIYLLGRRYTLKLIYSPGGGDEIVSIRDPLDNKLEVEVK